MTDLDLARRAERGDHGAFEALHAKYNDLALQVAMRETRSRVGADEAAAELWFWLITGRWRLDDAAVTATGELHAFVSTLARYAAWKAGYQTKASRNSVPTRETAIDRSPLYRLRAPQPNPEQLLLQKELAERIWRINRRVLPRAYRRAVEFFYRDGLDTREIAEILGVGRTTVPGYLMQGRRRLHRFFQRDGSPNPRTSAGNGSPNLQASVPKSAPIGTDSPR